MDDIQEQLKKNGFMALCTGCGAEFLRKNAKRKLCIACRKLKSTAYHKQYSRMRRGRPNTFTYVNGLDKR